MDNLILIDQTQRTAVEPSELAAMQSRGQLNGKQVVWASTGVELTRRELAAVAGPTLDLPMGEPRPANHGGDSLKFLAAGNESGWATVAGILGWLSVFLVFGPFALAAGLKALKDLKDFPNKTGHGKATLGVVMGALGSIGLLAFAAYTIINPQTPAP